MKDPGSGILEFEVHPVAPNKSRLVTTARFHPAGLVGLLYWYALVPVHNLIVKGMPRERARTAERAASRATTRRSP